MMKLTRKADYALRAMVHLSTVWPDGRAPIVKIAKEEGISREFAAKIMGELLTAGLVQSYQGPQGGYALARPPAEVNLLQIIEAVEGPISINTCVPEADNCQHSSVCAMYPVWKKASDQVRSVMAETTLSSLNTDFIPPT